MMQDLPTTPENEVLFGRLAVKAGYCTPGQLIQALRLLKQVRELGKEITLGEVMVKKGFLTSSQVENILTEQGFENQDLIAGFRVVKKLGEGGMGKVFKAVQISMDREVALKIMSKRLARNEQYVERFFREARSAGRLNHPNVVQGYDSGTCGDYHYFAMEYVEGESVAERLKREGKLEEVDCLNIVMKVAEALEHARVLDIVHRDIKPDNILIGPSGMVKISDLGLAKESFDADLTREGMAIGTPNYISPEQAKAESQIDTRADIYSLGASLFHMLTGEVPFSGDSIEVILTKHVVEAPRSVREIRPSLSDAVDHLVMKMMAKGPEQRFQTPNEVVEAIRAILDGSRSGELPARDRAEMAQLYEALKVSAPITVDGVSSDLLEVSDFKKAKFKALQKEYAPNSIVFYEGQAPDRVYFLIEGQVEILRAGRVRYVIDTAGTYFGEISMLKECPREYTARAVTTSRIVELTRTEYFKVLRVSPKLCMTVIERLSRQLRNTGDHLLVRDKSLEATRTQLQFQKSKESEIKTQFKMILQEHKKGVNDLSIQGDFWQKFSNWIKTHDVSDWLHGEEQDL